MTAGQVSAILLKTYHLQQKILIQVDMQTMFINIYIHTHADKSIRIYFRDYINTYMSGMWSTYIGNLYNNYRWLLLLHACRGFFYYR